MNEIIKSKDYKLHGITNMETYDHGGLKSCILSEENIIESKYGRLIPQYRVAEYGERQKKYRDAISFYENGEMKSVALENQVPIQTPIGTFPAELVTFHEDGSLRRVFPLNGKIDGFWSEEDEGRLCEPFVFELMIGKIEAKIIGINFYRSGGVKSITLWPGEVVELEIKDQVFHVRNGISFYEDGHIKSIEPAKETTVKTPIGEISAYDKDAIGIHGDTNSLVFSKEGNIIQLVTTHSGVRVEDINTKAPQWIEPMLVDSLIEDDEKTLLPVQIYFDKDKVRLKDNVIHTFDIRNSQFQVYIPMTHIGAGCSDCSQCTSCG